MKVTLLTLLALGASSSAYVVPYAVSGDKAIAARQPVSLN